MTGTGRDVLSRREIGPHPNALIADGGGLSELVHVDRARESLGLTHSLRISILVGNGVIRMAKMPETVVKAWEGREGPIVLATVDREGTPNAIYATCVGKPDDEHLVVADNYFSKTRANIEAGSKGALLFITKGGEAYQVKGTVQRHTSGLYFAGMKKWLDPKMPGHAAAVLSVEEVYCGSEKLL